ncbi:hypothetical protein HDV64DRAFT_244598 [Trichoderma sp. TUCIM 5745]
MQRRKVTLTPCMLRARVAASAADLVWQGEAEPLWWEVTWSSRAVLLFQRCGCTKYIAKTVETEQYRYKPVAFVIIMHGLTAMDWVTAVQCAVQ